MADVPLRRQPFVSKPWTVMPMDVASLAAGRSSDPAADAELAAKFRGAVRVKA
ncbi:hypothetical protein ACFY9A_09800 [Streptomyces rubradiris]|uniref:hypothetical protein n=1 Tax=Streptomyces rubradiris TaxID=285531 RepID=UPI0036E36E39